MSLSMHAELKLQPKRGEPIPLEVRLETGRISDLQVSYWTNEDDRPRRCR